MIHSQEVALKCARAMSDETAAEIARRIVDDMLSDSNDLMVQGSFTLPTGHAFVLGRAVNKQ